MIGQTLGHYRVVEQIGAGGMGEVYRAHDERLDRDVAIKVLPASSFSDPTARARLLREARTASQLNHPHICTIHEVGEADGQAYIAMKTPTNTAVALLAGGQGRDFRPMLGKLDKPVLYTITPELKQDGEFLKAKVPKARVEVFENSGHSLFVDEAERFNMLLEEFARTAFAAESRRN
ncbi:MAG: protein kinase domain-containing protein [Terriglobales bacterium]